ncbi:MAG: tRNA lysidine(34) synthetase TilS [Coriobacteriia bacterium]|nr:tRNA lysidine(34) synthetase TilS [Coriobacteriia bacterium]MBN2821951.1 tRNA lysidine(34) synthetase TilS [Coriobacteriia bacterium]
MSLLPDTARATASEHEMLPVGSVVLALVSGGADSVSLLRLLADGQLGDDLRLSVLHVNHMLRGDAANADEAFVGALCAELDIPCRIVRFDVAAYAEAEGLNLEDAGRRVRYRFAEDELDARCESLGVSPLRGRIAVAHTLNDQLETFLMRLVTGSGPAGLRAIAPVRGRIVRPLLGARRTQVVEYLESLGQSWREDATNADTSRLRSWVRHELKPLVESVNPAFDTTLERTIRLLSDEDGLLSEMAEAFSYDFTEPVDDGIAFNRDYMATLSRPMARRTVRESLFRTFPEATRLEFEHVEALVDGLAEDSFARDLPFGLHARTEYGKLVVSHRDAESIRLAPCLLEVPGTCDLGQLGVIEARFVRLEDVNDDPQRAFVDGALVGEALTVDRPRQGDRFRPLGMDGSKKLSDLFIDGKVPKRLRVTTPVIRYRDRIVWVAGLRLSDEFKVTTQTTGVLELHWRGEQTST